MLSGPDRSSILSAAGKILRILFVNHSASLTGAPISCFHIMAQLGDGFTPVFAAGEKGPIIERLQGLGIAHYIVDDKGFLGIDYIRAFMKILDSERIDLLHLNTLTSFCKYAGIAGYLKRIPIVWFVRENPLISRSRRLAVWMKALASKIVFVDGDTRERLLRTGRNEKVLVIHNGVDLEAFQPRSCRFLADRLALGPDERLIGYVGSITKRKGLESLIRALPQIKKGYGKIRLVIVGEAAANDEPYFLELKELIRRLSLEGLVHFIGMQRDVRDALNSLDVVVLPSHEERCSRTLLESLASGKAVVATRVGGTPEIIEDRISGLLVEPGNEGQIAEAVLTLLLDDRLRESLGTNGRLRAEKHFDLNKTIEKMKNLYIATASKR